MKYGFIGLGNMASAIIGGMTASGRFSADTVIGYDVFSQAVDAAKEKFGITAAKSETEVVNDCNVIVFAVKPQVMPEVLERVTKTDLNGKTLISIAAGKAISFLEGYLGKNAHIIRVMPNINAFVGHATTAYTANEAATDDDKSIAENMLTSIGSVTYLPEKLFSTFTALCGSSPAFVYTFIDAMARAAVQGGMPCALAKKLAADVVLGSAKMVLDSGIHPMELTDRVCSPAGTTIDGVLSLQNDRFEATVERAVKAVIDKDKSM